MLIFKSSIKYLIVKGKEKTSDELNNMLAVIAFGEVSIPVVGK